MAIVAIILFALTAMGGVYLLTYVLEEKNTPKGIAIIHGVAGSLAIISLLIAAFFYHVLFYILIIFIAAAIGGGILLFFDLSGKKIPKFLAIGHGVLAITGFIILAVVIFH
ncbi:hypothetical protein [Legionella saoudiensis]|uniref:hypothetical protein n=1 Tax=Legionella saoudiensis TaxID=1750561 RepID=UPI0007306B46|nr:hypothetical protein [Legionella saoudiensis]